MRNAEEKSELDLDALAFYGVRARGAKPAFEGVSAMAERSARELPKIEKSSLTRKTPTGEKADGKEALPESDVRGDRSREMLESLDEFERKIFEEMPLDRAVSADYFAANGENLASAMFALTTLEIKGLVSSLPGALYIRK